MSNGDLVFYFFDDFNGNSLNTSKWTIEYSDIPYSINNGILYINLLRTDDGLATTLRANLPFTLNDSNVKNYIFEAYIKVNGQSNPDYTWILSGLAVGRGDSGKNWDNNFIVGWNGFYDRYALHSWITDGRISYIKDIQIQNVTNNNWYLYKLYVYSNNNATACIGNSCVTANWDIGTGTYYLRIGGQGSYSEYWYDFIIVRKFSSPEPTIFLGNEVNIQ